METQIEQEKRDIINKANAIAKILGGDMSHYSLNAYHSDSLITMHFNFPDNRDINRFMHDLHVNHIGLLLENTSKTSCAVLI